MNTFAIYQENYLLIQSMYIDCMLEKRGVTDHTPILSEEKKAYYQYRKVLRNKVRAGGKISIEEKLKEFDLQLIAWPGMAKEIEALRKKWLKTHKA